MENRFLLNTSCNTGVKLSLKGLKAETKIVPSVVETKPNKNADNINVNANDKATNQLSETNVFAAGTLTGLNPWTYGFVPRKSTMHKA